MIWWKIYFWVFAVLTGIGLISILFSINNKLNLGDWLGVVLNTILVVSTYSFVFRKSLLSQEKWKVLFLVTAAFWVVNFVYEFLLPENLKMSLSFLESGIKVDKPTAMFSFIFILPALYIFYKLAYKK